MMNSTDENDPSNGDATPVASSPCSLHEIDAEYAGLVMPARPPDNLAAWRRGERERLIGERMALSVDLRTTHAGAIATQLDHEIGVGSRKKGTIVSLYWPFRGEPDLRPWMQSAFERGMRIALPLVIAKAQPLEFREWTPGCSLARGVWNIPYPEDGAVVDPDIVIAPLVGFDAACYRLGYGGGFFDRTLARYPVKPMAIGVGHKIGALPSIYPQSWDIPMDLICNGEEVRRRQNASA